MNSTIIDVEEDNLNTPLHLAASLGLSHYTQKIIQRKPESCLRRNREGLTPLHVASAKGHLAIVRDLLSGAGPEQCRVPDKNGLFAVHSAASNGKLEVLEELMEDDADALTRETTRGVSILHLAVMSDNFEVINFLVEKLEGENNHEFLKSRDDKGNTVLHLAAARNNIEAWELLVNKPWADVNAVNRKGETVLDMYLQSKRESQNSDLEGKIKDAGGRRGTYRPEKKWFLLLEKLWRYLSSSQKPPLQQQDKNKGTRQTLMVVATLIATITFDAAMQLLGNSDQTDAYSSDCLLAQFLFVDMIGFIFSLSVILLMICGCSGRKYMINVAMWMLWMAVFFTGLTFFSILPRVFPREYYYPDNFYIYPITWPSVIYAFIVFLVFRFLFAVFRKVIKRNKKKTEQLDGEIMPTTAPCQSSKANRLALVIPLFIVAWIVLSVVIILVINYVALGSSISAVRFC